MAAQGMKKEVDGCKSLLQKKMERNKKVFKAVFDLMNSQDSFKDIEPSINKTLKQ